MSADETPCPDDEELQDLIEGALPAARANEIRRHASSCEVCGPTMALLDPDLIPTAHDKIPVAPPIQKGLLNTMASSSNNVQSVAFDPTSEYMAISSVDPEPSAPLAANAVVDNYTIEALIGRGGMGEVYLARDKSLGRRVALKFIRAESSQGSTIERFLFEAKATAQVEHENVIRIYGTGTFRGRPYLALELLEGRSLLAMLRAQRLDEERIRDIASRVAQGIRAAHARHLVHRDLKPGNVFILRDGGVRVLDFGLAKLVMAPLHETPSLLSFQAQAQPFVTEQGAQVLRGTPGYMAPEQWLPDRPITPAVDVWALGLIILEMFNGQHPYLLTETAAVSAMVAQGRSPIDKEAYKSLPTQWQSMIRRCCSFDTEGRATLDELIDFLKRLAPQSSTADLDDDRVRAALHGYEILGSVGKGGMGEVFLAKRQGPAGFQKQCVIKKVLRSADSEATSRLLEEARLAARINHPNVVQVFDVVVEKESLFVVMEHVVGQTLKAVVDENKRHNKTMLAADLFNVMADVCAGLAAAHAHVDDNGNARPLLHRDISPDNIMVVENGSAKLLDFGLAVEIDEDTAGSYSRGGKLAFCAPELIAGQGASRASDLWAVGVTLYYALTGWLPFWSQTPDELRGQIATAAPQWSAVANDDVRRFLQGLLAKDPAQRITDAADAHRQLKALAVSTTLPTSFETTAITARRQGRSSLIAALALGTAVVGAAAFGLLRSSTEPQTISPPAIESALPPPVDDTKAPEPKDTQQPERVVPTEPPQATPRPTKVETPKRKTRRSRRQKRPVKAAAAKGAGTEMATRSVRVIGTPGTRWMDAKRRPLSVVGGKVDIVSSEKVVFATDKRTGGFHRVPVIDGVADLTRVGGGKLEILARPWANVRIGSVDVGATPVRPFPLRAGHYSIVLEREGKSIKRSVEIKEGQVYALRVEMSAGGQP